LTGGKQGNMSISVFAFFERVEMLKVMLIVMACQVEAPDQKPKAETPWEKEAAAHVRGYVLVPQANGGSTYRLVDQAVTQHVQNVRGNSVGSVYVWCEESGRPAAICDVFFLPSPGGKYHLSDEWHSLTSASMTARRESQVRWSPSEPGLEWKEIPGAGQPDHSTARRQLQIRQLSRRFTGHCTTRTNDRFELRLLNTPIFRYDTVATEESLGGGLFAFCQGNDPELLLVIEARKTESGYRWEYAPAEFSNMNLYLRLDDKEVWQAAPPRFSSNGRHTGGPLRETDIAVEGVTKEP
jgi:hypothetical protein